MLNKISWITSQHFVGKKDDIFAIHLNTCLLKEAQLVLTYNLPTVRLAKVFSISIFKMNNKKGEANERSEMRISSSFAVCVG